MATLVLAIETIGRDWKSFSQASQQSLLRQLKQSSLTDEQRSDYQQEVINKLSLSPFTGRIISLAMFDVERDLKSVYFVADDNESNFSNGSFTYKVSSEHDILEDFWEGAINYDSFVTFNGRAFTMPFLYQRSVVNKIKPSFEIAKERSLIHQSLPYHIDLLDEFTNNGAVFPRPSLAIVADMYNLEYDPICGGDEVAEFFLQKKFRHLAERNANNVICIAELYKIWKQNLAPLAFINALEM